MGYEDDDLKPYVEPPKDVRDERRILKLQALGYNLQQIHEALDKERFEEIHATYLLLKEKKNLSASAQDAAAATAASASSKTSSAIDPNTSAPASVLSTAKTSTTGGGGEVSRCFRRMLDTFLKV